MATVLDRQIIPAGQTAASEYVLPLTTAELIYVFKRFDWPAAGDDTLRYSVEVDTGYGWQFAGGGSLSGGSLDGVEEHRDSVVPDQPYQAGAKARVILTAKEPLETQVDLGLIVWP